MEAQKIKVGVIDDQQLFRQGIISLLKEFKSLEIMLEANNGKELLKLLTARMPDVILLDIEMPVMDGIEATQAIKEKYPDLKIIILTMHNEEEMIMYMIEKGVHGFLPKNEHIDKVVDAIHSVKETGYYFNTHISNAMIKNLISSNKIEPKIGPADLSDREKEIIKLICMELSNKEIGERLSISDRTVDSHRVNILKKTKAKNVAGIVMYAVKHKLIV